MKPEELIGNRETKFRAWNPKLKVFTFFNLNNLGDLGFVWLKMTTQYTGLKDKNGKEIYEGDVLRCLSGREVRPVVFRNGCFYLERIPNNKLSTDKYIPVYGYHTSLLHTVEVIGNIFENPELIKS